MGEPLAVPASTAEIILDAAEAVFAADGDTHASLRCITSHAGVNIAAVNYHFGSKDGLIKAVLERRMGELNRERLRRLDELESGDEPPRPSQLIKAYFGPLITFASQQNSDARAFVALIERSVTNPNSFTQAIVADQFEQVVLRYRNAFHAALPQVPKAEVSWRFQFMLGATAYALYGSSQLALLFDVEESHEESLARLEPRLMSFLLGGLRTPLPEVDGNTP
ncbi:TetR/AcrR family transcriptional regulator [Carnimonas bestiolae]|uniref:TetR/AcrR family transcriptional regulator n=1 Tax=Carnimonas bestiolae TaxID=3402172 RepID=UPI003EDC5AD5